MPIFGNRNRRRTSEWREDSVPDVNYSHVARIMKEIRKSPEKKLTTEEMMDFVVEKLWFGIQCFRRIRNSRKGKVCYDVIIGELYKI